MSRCLARYGLTDTARELAARRDPITNREDRARYVVETVIRNYEVARVSHDFGYSHSASYSVGREGIGL